MPEIGGERYSVQKPLIDYVREPKAEYLSSDGKKIFVNLGWQYISPDEAVRLRGGETNLILREIFKRQILKFNSSFMTEDKIDQLITKLEKLPARIEGNLECWEYLCGLKTIFDENEKRERNITFIDENIENNVFHVTDEFTFTNGVKTNRYDAGFFINGIPVILVETKAAHKSEGLAEALEQVKRYHRETPEAMTVFQLFALTHIIHFYYSATWNFSLKNLFNWKTETHAKYFEELVKTFFDRKRVVDTLIKFILFTRQDDELKKVVLRPHQMRAVNQVVSRAVDNEKRRGLIWHTQGAGKTYTMIVAAKQILENPFLENPTVIMLVDRNELESQLFANLKAVGFEIDESRIANSKRHLKELLERDTRGLIVSMIHKFEGIPENINTRKNIFVLVDEAHRSTGGDLGNYLMGALPNATYIGFTGTPIDKTFHGRGTFKTFGSDDEKGYLDKYSILESIEDGTTVRLHYALAPNELRPQKEVLEKEFFNLAEAEGISDIETLNKVLERAVVLKNMLKSRERIKNVADSVKNHFTENVEPMGYKAFLVAVDREACVLYKQELDKLLPAEYSEVVISSAHNDPQRLQKYHLSEKEEIRIRKAFRQPDGPPKILIVTEKLLTGFDAPILYCMYLDKPMRDHVLLQAIARVNRPYEDRYGRKKPCGFVLDFIGIFDNLEKALKFDSKDLKDIQRVVTDINKLKDDFIRLIEEGKKEYLSLIKDKSRDKAVEIILERFADKEERNDYYRFYKILSESYEIISPDAILRPYIEDYDTFTRIYKILKEAFEQPAFPVNKEFTRKTAELVQKHTESDKIELSLNFYEINEDTLKKLNESSASDIEKILSIIKVISDIIKRESFDNPYLFSIGDKAEKISREYKEMQENTKAILEKLKNLVKEIIIARQEQKKSGLSKEEFSIFMILKDENLQNPQKLAKNIMDVLEDYPHWCSYSEHEREAKQKINKVLINNNLSAGKSVSATGKILMILKRAKSEG